MSQNRPPLMERSELIARISEAYNVMRELEYATECFVGEKTPDDTVQLCVSMVNFERETSVTLAGFKSVLIT